MLRKPSASDFSRPPNARGAGAAAVLSEQEPDMTIVFFNEPSREEDRGPPRPELLTSRSLTPLNPLVTVLAPDPLPATPAESLPDPQAAPPESAVAADAAQHALFFGRYLTQVQARIERAWMRPRSEIGAARFLCRARILQDRRGAVVSVLLDRCNGTERWQQFLLAAIRTASPLPAPPDPSVYADVLWLNFESEGFRAGELADGFEPASPAALTASSLPTEQGSLERFGKRMRGNVQTTEKEALQVIHLTIIGSPNAASAPSGATPPTPSVQPPPDPESAPSVPQ